MIGKLSGTDWYQHKLSTNAVGIKEIDSNLHKKATLTICPNFLLPIQVTLPTRIITWIDVDHGAKNSSKKQAAMQEQGRLCPHCISIGSHGG